MFSLNRFALWLVVLISITYTVLALIERFTHVRIGRIGYLSLRHIGLPSRRGLKVDIGFIGLRFHRPTITNPTWISIIVKNIVVHMDLDAFNTKSTTRSSADVPQAPKQSRDRQLSDIVQRFKDTTSQVLVKWIELKVIDTSVNITGCGMVQLGTFSLHLSHRAKHKVRRLNNSADSVEKDLSAMLSADGPALRGLEITAHLLNLRFQLEDENPSEVFDDVLVRVWSDFGGLYGLHNIGISCKFGKVTLIADDLSKFASRVRKQPAKEVQQLDTIEAGTSTGPSEGVSHMTDFNAISLLEILTEVQVHIGFCKISYQAVDVAPGGKAVLLTGTSKDVVFDLNRMHEESPDFRMLFEPGVLAHQALVSLISFTVSMEANNNNETIVSIPMITLATKSTILSQLVQTTMAKEDLDTRSTSINTVITGPALDIRSSQLPVLLALLRPRVDRHGASQPTDRSSTVFALRDTLPKLQFSFNVHDPSVRVVLDEVSMDNLPPMIIGRLSFFSAELHGWHESENYKLTVAARTTSGRLYYHSPTNEEFDVLQSDHIHIKLSCSPIPFSNCFLAIIVDGFRFHLSRTEIISCFSTITAALQAPVVLPTKLASPRKHNVRVPPLQRIPSWLEEAKLQIQRLSISVSGADDEVAPDTRGLNIRLEDGLIDYGKALTIGKSEEEIPEGQDFYKGHLSETLKRHRDSVEKSNLNRKILATLKGLKACTIDSQRVLDRDYPILVLPLAEIAVSQENAERNVNHHVAFRAEDLALGFSIYKVYAVLQALQVLRTSFVRRSATSDQKAEDVHTKIPSLENAENADDSETPYSMTLEGKVNLIRLKSRLPLDEIQMFDIDHLQVAQRIHGDPVIQARYFRLYVASPVYADSWDRIASIRDVQVSRETHIEKVGQKSISSKSFVLRTDGIRVRIPHQFVFYKMLEAIINSVKTSTQIVHRFVTQTNDYIIAQHPKKATRLPRIRLKSRMLTIEVEDDPFESRLGLIFRVGLSEQRMRESRETSFDRTVIKLRQEHIGSDLRAQRTKTNGTHASSSTKFDSSSLRSHPRHSDSPAKLPRQSEDSCSTNNMARNEEFSEEREKLLEHHSHAWILRMQHALIFRQKTMNNMRQQKWGRDIVSNGNGLQERVLEVSNRPPLFSMNFTSVDLIVDRPSFPLDEIPQYINRVGRGMPLDMQYSLLIPVSLSWKMDEARIQVRDYPLPLLHIPPLHSSQKTHAKAWEFTTDLVIAEEFPEEQAIRHIDVCVIPADTGRQGSPAFNVEVQRTASAVKTYAEISIGINSSLPTRIHWGTSMQPGVADAMRILDTLTKPQQDPSPKLGFWDKIGLSMHVSTKLAWNGDGDMHITLKGSRDPYVVMGTGAGLTKIFRGNVHWDIGVSSDSRNLMEVLCDEYMLAIPDFSRRTSSPEQPRNPSAMKEMKKKNSLHHYHLSRKDISFQKILMKLTGDVRWTAGLAFERHCEEDECDRCGGKMQCRHWDFEPHWHVKMRIPEYSILPGGKLRDAFKGYRSHYIHGQISVTSRARDDSGSYNTMHLTPKSFAHFFDWINSFSGNLSLPIRTGPLFPSIEGPKQKFGQHLMTLKYRLKIEPLYLSHVYKSTSAHDPGKVELTGIKARIDSFTLDLHQRKEERVVTNKLLETERKSQHMAIYRGQVDLRVTDLRALTATFVTDQSESLHAENTTKNPMDSADVPRAAYAVETGDFDVSEEDQLWIDLDDFTELDTVLPEVLPKCRIIPLAYAPKFIYDRDTTHLEGAAQSKQDESSNVMIPGQRFGFEETHVCSMAAQNQKAAHNGSKFSWQILQQTNEAELGETQKALWAARQEHIRSELQANEVRIAEVKDKLTATPHSQAINEEVRHSSWGRINHLLLQLSNLEEYHRVLSEKQKFVADLSSNVDKFFAGEIMDARTFDNFESANNGWSGQRYLQALIETAKTFNNRFVVHNVQMKWNNTLRNVLIRYIQHVTQRRGFSYYMSQKAVRFLANLVDEQKQSRNKPPAPPRTDKNDSANGGDETPESDLEDDINELLQQLINDREQNFFVADESKNPPSQYDQETQNRAEDTPSDDLGELHKDYVAENNYILRLIAPQIQLQSEKSKDTAIVLTAQSMEMKILAIRDKTIASDDVSALVSRRFTVRMSSAQFFYAHQSGFHGAIATLLTQNSYGADGDSYWPPWIPIEAVYDFERTPRSFARIVNRTSALCLYTKNNNLRIKQNDRTTMSSNKINGTDTEEMSDSITVHFPKFNISVDSAQYYAMFTIVMDLLMYSEPLQKERNEQIEKILLAADFSDLSGTPELVSNLQKRIRHLNDFKIQFKLHAQRNDPQSKHDEIKVEKELEGCEEELFFLMKSIATAQQKHEDRDNEVIPAMKWHLKADEILWHLMDGKKAFIDFGLSQASFQRTDNSDSSNLNTLEIEMMQGINLSPEPIFAELFAPYFGSDRTVVDARRSKMVRVYWYMLEAIGGISVCDHFEVNLFPLRLQMEHDVGKKIMAYVFPEKQKRTGSQADSDSDSDGNNSESGSSDDDGDAASTHTNFRDNRKLSRISRLRKSASLSRLTHKHSSSGLRKDTASIDSQESELSNGTNRLSRTESVTSLQRPAIQSSQRMLATNGKHKKNGSSDDLTAMLNRASQNMSLVYVKVPSVVLSLSYKGAKAKNFVDVTDFVFKMPNIEYRNKTWSYLDLAEHLKKEVIRAVLAHTGSLLKDKMIHYRKSKSHQPTLVRQLTSYRTFVPAEASESRLRDVDEDSSMTSQEFSIQNRTSTAETSSIHDSHSHGLFNNAIGRHIHHLSNIARHKDGLGEDNAESTLKKTRLLLGKFIEKAK